MRHCLVFLSQSTGPVRLAVPVNSEKFDSRRPSGKKKLKNPPRPFGQKKITTLRPKSHPKKSSRPITNTSNPRFRDWVKFSETHVSQGTILYCLYPLLKLSLSLADSLHSTCRFLTFPLSAWPVTNMALQFSLDFSQ